MNALKFLVKISNKLKTLLVIMIMSGICLAVQAQPAGNRAIEDTEVETLDGCSKVTVYFVFPVQFLSFFPEESGSELRVQFRPLAVGSSNALGAFFNEPVRLMDDTSVNISRFEYVGGRSSTDPYLWLVSPDTFYFQAKQGEDFRSIVLYLSPNPIANCE